MICSECKKESPDIILTRVPNFYGGTRIKQICDDCFGELQDYWESKREELRINEENNRVQ